MRPLHSAPWKPPQTRGYSLLLHLFHTLHKQVRVPTPASAGDPVDPANGWKGLLLSPTPRGVGGRAASFPTRIPPVTLVKHGRAFPAAENAGYAGASSGKPWVQRRRFLGLMGRGVALVAGLGLSDGSALARTKVTKEAADYQDSPKSGQQCSECQFWQGANICSRVKGPISPQGWCALYKPKAEPKS